MNIGGNFVNGVVDTGGKFALDVVNTRGVPLTCEYLSNVIFMGWGEDNS